MIIAATSEIAGLEGWPLALVLCVAVISLASFLMGRWPWQKDQ